jgi:hypothetical protein
MSFRGELDFLCDGLVFVVSVVAIEFGIVGSHVGGCKQYAHERGYGRSVA